MVAAALAVFIANRRVSRTPPRESANAYAPVGSCKSCHVKISATYAQIGMAKAFYRPTTSNIIEDYAEKESRFSHQRSGRHYRMIARDGKFGQRRYELDEKGREINVFEREVTHIIGSGNHARTYLHLSASGELTQLPVSWYSQEKRWSMSPGYDNARHFDFKRRVDHGCFFCHNAYPGTSAGSDQYGVSATFFAPLPEGIDCQRCHGPGARHVQLASAGNTGVDAVRGAIVNPARLSSDRQLDVCLQCHLETTSSKLPHAIRRFGRAVYSFVPGERLSDYLVQFDHPPGIGYDDKFEINSSGYRLRKSRCFLESQGRLQCTTCHDPHSKPAAAQAAAHYRSRCVSCHAKTHHQPSGDCVSCHMPRRRTDDVVHVIMTDHLIARNRPGRNLLADREEAEKPYRGDLVMYDPPTLTESERDLYMGMGLLSDGADRTRGIAMLEQAISRTSPAPVETLVELAIAYFAEGSFSKAAPLYEQALHRRPQMPKVRYNYARTLERQGQTERAKTELEQVLREEPNFAEALNNFGLLLMKQGETTRARQLFQSAIAAAPDSAEARNNMGLAHMAAGDRIAAREQFELALEADPAFPDACNNLARLLGLQGDTQAAVRYLQRTLMLDPFFTEARYNLARILQEQGQDEAAITEYRTLLRHEPGFVEAHVSLGVVLGEKGRLSEAINEFRAALSLQPNHAAARKNLELALELSKPPRLVR